LWIFGGYHNTYVNDIWSSTNGLDWELETNNFPFTPYQILKIVEFKSNLWLVRGGSNGISYSSDGNFWNQASTSNVFSEREAHQAIVYKDKIWVFSSLNLNDVWYSENGSNWTCANSNANFPSESWDSSMTSYSSVVYNDQLWYFNKNVWNSTDGTNWVLVSSNLPAGYDSVITYSNKIYLFGSSGEVWNSTNGIDWMQVNQNAKYGNRNTYPVTKFKNTLWVIGGKEGPFTRLNDVWYYSK
jgi:hypothetical protein